MGAAIAALLLIAAACGGDGGGGGEGDGEAERDVIRFAFAPDPVWDWMNDTGMIVEWEEEFNTRIVTSSTWDEFTFFAGGHGDIVSMGTYEIPVLESETDLKTVSFGKYNLLRVPLFTRADEDYETLADVPKGSKICVQSAVSNTIFWSVVASELHDLDYRVGGGDFELVVNDHFLNPDLLARGECEAAAIIPEAAVPYLREGELKLMYDGQMPFQLYQDITGSDHLGPHSNLFTATEEWFDENEDLAAAFLDLWERGMQAWQENQQEIIETYPQHFAVEDEADVQWISDFMAEEGNDWFVDSVYLDEAWIEEEKKFYDFMDENGWIEEGANKDPRYEAVEPPEGA
ncbi:MAG: ABC transporter substrate-binding protein [Actinobacteria bacterium]|nr:ABC transporter substrate-binding protein [Actinomycetota bacterium]